MRVQPVWRQVARPRRRVAAQPAECVKAAGKSVFLNSLLNHQHSGSLGERFWSLAERVVGDNRNAQVTTV